MFPDQHTRIWRRGHGNFLNGSEQNYESPSQDEVPRVLAMDITCEDENGKEETQSIQVKFANTCDENPFEDDNHIGWTTIVSFGD